VDVGAGADALDLCSRGTEGMEGKCRNSLSRRNVNTNVVPSNDGRRSRNRPRTRR